MTWNVCSANRWMKLIIIYSIYMLRCQDYLKQYTCMVAGDKTCIDNLTHAPWVDYHAVKKGNIPNSHIQNDFHWFCTLLWLKHNQRVFEKKSRTAKQVIEDIVYYCCVRVSPRLKIVTNSLSNFLLSLVQSVLVQQHIHTEKKFGMTLQENLSIATKSKLWI